MAYGFIYFLANPSMPGLTKIGMTHKHPRERMAELTKATACPTPFEILAFFDVVNPREVERAIHQELEELRVNPHREFFDVHPIGLQDLVREWGDPLGGVCFSAPIDKLVESFLRDEDKAFAAMLGER